MIGVKYIFPLMAMAVMALAGAGCFRNRAPGVYVGSPSRYIKDLKPGDALAVVDGEKISKADYQSLLELQETLFRLYSKLPLVGRNEKAERFTFANEQRWPEILLKNALMRHEAARLGLAVDNAARAATWQRYMKSFRRFKGSVADLKAELDEKSVKALDRLVAAEALNELVLAAVTTNAYAQVTAQEITNRMEWVKAFNKNADDRNAEARAVLKKARTEILGGMKFADAAKKYSEVKPEDGREWETFELGELPDDRDGKKNELRVWLEKAQVGDISEPLDLDDGVSIVGLVAKFEGEAPEGVAKPTCHRLVRCTRFAREHSQDQNFEETRKQLLTWKREDELAKLGKRIFAAAVIEFPHGTNFFPSATESQKYWQEQFKKRR